jgi:hypothetical protein
MEPARQDILALACRKGISFQAARGILESRALQPGYTGGPVAGPSVPSDPVRAAKGKRQARIKPAPAPSPACRRGAGGGGRDPGKGDDATPILPVVVLTMPPPPPPAARADDPSPQRAAELSAIDAWLAANPVRREVDWGDLRDDVEALRRAGYSVARAPMGPKGGAPIYLVGGMKLRKSELKAYARKVAEGETRWQNEACR